MKTRPTAIARINVNEPDKVILPAPLVSVPLAVTAALFALTAEGILLALCLVIVLDLVEVILEVDDDDEVDEPELVEDEVFEIELLLLILVLPFTHCAKVGKV